MIDRAALERHCELAFASWNDGPTVDYQLGEQAGNLVIKSAWSTMSDADKAYWRGLWAPLFLKQGE